MQSMMQPVERDWLAHNLPQKASVLEIGTWVAETARELCERRPDVTWIACDTLAGCDYGGLCFTDEAMARLLSNVRDTPNLSLWIGDIGWLRGNFDVVIVDGNHDAEAVTADLERASLRAVTIMAHDYGQQSEQYRHMRPTVQAWCQRRGWMVDETPGISAVLRRQ